jgi:hypothetical protein
MAGPSAHRRGHGEQGFAVIVMTALLLLPMITFAAFGVDLASWYGRINHLQASADAAALSGTVWMPNVQKATTVATDSLQRNGIVNGADDVTVVIGEGSTPTSLRVAITDHSATRVFSKLIGGSQVLARSAEAEYFLPLPLGSPLNYFGGDQSKTATPDTVVTTVTWPVPYNSTTRPPAGPFTCNVGTTSAQGFGQWTNASTYSAAGFSGSAQCNWSAATANTSPTATTQVPSNVPCNRIQAPVSNLGRWNSGILGALPLYSGSNRFSGSSGTGNRQCIWAVTGTEPPDAAVRSPRNAPCNVTGELLRGSWNSVLTLPVFLPVTLLAAGLCEWLPVITTTTTTYPNPIPSDQSPGFWAQAEGPGTVTGYGDAFSNRCTTALNCSTVQNAQWRDTGYWYVIKATTTGPIELSVFDASYRRAGDINTDTGDYNLNPGATIAVNPDFATEYRVYRQTNPLDVNQRVPYGSASAASQTTDSCWWSITNQTAFDLQWKPLCPINATAGETYLLNVRTSDTGAAHGAGINGYALHAIAPGTTQPQLYAYSDMGMFNNGSGTFYLAEVGPSFAGKVLDIDLWDPGDVASGTATLYPRMPSTTQPKPVRDAPATCTYTSAPDPNAVNTTAGAWFSTGTRYATAHASDSVTKCAIDTAPTGSAHRFNDEWLHIRIQIPTDYTCTVGLNPELMAGSCWWGINYSFTQQPYDVTTWKARIEGDPVHLTS